MNLLTDSADFACASKTNSARRTHSRIPKYKSNISLSNILLRKPSQSELNNNNNNNIPTVGNAYHSTCLYTSDTSLQINRDKDEIDRLRTLIADEQHRFNYERSRYLKIEKKMIDVSNELNLLKKKHLQMTEELKSRPVSNDHEIPPEQNDHMQSEGGDYAINSQTTTNLISPKNTESNTNLSSTEINNIPICLHEIPSIEYENDEVQRLKCEVKSLRKKFVESWTNQKSIIAKFESRDAERSNEIALLRKQLQLNEKKLAEYRRSIKHLKLLLNIRTDLIEAMQEKDEFTARQLKYYNRLLNEKSEECKILAMAITQKDEELCCQTSLVAREKLDNRQENSNNENDNVKIVEIHNSSEASEA